MFPFFPKIRTKKTQQEVPIRSWVGPVGDSINFDPSGAFQSPALGAQHDPPEGTVNTAPLCKSDQHPRRQQSRPCNTGAVTGLGLSDGLR